MKIKITAAPGERIAADLVLCELKKMLPDSKVRVSTRHEPFTHVYIETPKPKTEPFCGGPHY